MQEHLRIAMFGHKRMPSHEGGIEIVVEELAVRMVQMGHEVTCYNRKGHHVSGKQFDEKQMSEYRGVRLKGLPTLDKKGLAALTSSFAGSILTAFGKYDVVHIHAEGPAAFCWLPRLMGKRVVVTVHGLDWARAKWKGSFGSKYIHFGEKMAVRFADEIIVLNESTQAYFKEKYGRETLFIPNGVTRPETRPAQMIEKEFALTKDSYILYLGRIVPEKGGYYLCEAFKKLHTDKKLVIAGGSSDSQEYFDELKRLAADDARILFTGFVDGQIREELYSNAYAFVLPSDLEGMPLSLLEAMSYGNCVITSDIEECTSVAEDCGLTFKKGDAEDLLRVLQEVCDQPQRVEQMKKQVADFVCSKYNWNDIAARTVEVYRHARKQKD